MIFDVIIPVYHPDEKLDEILKSLLRQVATPRHILLMLTLDAPGDEKALSETYRARDAEKIRTFAVTKTEYDHAATRNKGVSLMEEGAEAFLMMTQDAVPADDHMTERLIEAFEDAQVAAAYARQLTGLTDSVAEKCARRFNYPAQSCKKTIADTERLGIKAFFCSNVCAMYRKDVFEELGGFEAPAIFNEDMVYAARALRAGYATFYQAAACVTHAHRYNLRMQFKRSFDNGASQAIRAEVFAGVPPEKEGKRYVKETVKTLRGVRQSGKIPYFLLQCACRYAGFRYGRNYNKLSPKKRCAMSMNPSFWTKYDSLTVGAE
ncbi:MAG: glycosyltransferase [Lachnospiraceae bacterium]|nr:glycosyltransferase [Lachnospiraceae bacterium]